MGFPVGYSELVLPKLLLQVVFFLGFLRRIISSVFNAIGLGDLLDSDAPWPDLPGQIRGYPHQPPEIQSVSAMLIKEILPVVRFEDLLAGKGEIKHRPVAGGCAVCLYEIEARDEVRRLSNCRHVFHRCCLDRWMEHDQRTCPLCRTPLVPEELQEAFNLRMWAAVGDPDDFAADSAYSTFPPPSPSQILPHQILTS